MYCFLKIRLMFSQISSGSSGRVGGGEKHEIYMAAFGSHLFYDLFLQDGGRGHGPLGPPGSATANAEIVNIQEADPGFP